MEEVSMLNIDNADEKELSEIKTWFFKENIRIMQAKQELEEERRAFEKEKKNTLREIKRKKDEEELISERLKRDQDLLSLIHI